jgi:hypothetical protein
MGTWKKSACQAPTIFPIHHHSLSPGLSSRVKPRANTRPASRLRGLTPAAVPVFWLPCLRRPSLPLNPALSPIRHPEQAPQDQNPSPPLQPAPPQRRLRPPASIPDAFVLPQLRQILPLIQFVTSLK